MLFQSLFGQTNLFGWDLLEYDSEEFSLAILLLFYYLLSIWDKIIW